MYEISQEGPTKLCPSCCRFMRIDKQRRLLPHKKFLSNIDCPGENTSNQALHMGKKQRCHVCKVEIGEVHKPFCSVGNDVFRP